jgi:hypothetical protein
MYSLAAAIALMYAKPLYLQLLARFEQAISRETSRRPREYLVDPVEEEDEATIEEMREGGNDGP